MKIKGGILAARQAFVVQHFGDEAWPHVLQSLPSEHREALSGLLLPSTWFPFEVGQKLDDAIVQVLGHGRTAVFEQIGAGSAEKNLTASHRHFLAPGRPMEFMAKAPMIYGFYYDTGRRTWEAAGESGGVLTTYDAETFSTADCLTVIGWYRRALEMCGAQGVAMTETSCRARGGAHCRYEVTWQSVGAPA